MIYFCNLMKGVKGEFTLLEWNIFVTFKNYCTFGSTCGNFLFLVKKNKQANRTRKSENDLIKLKDTLLISHQLRAVLLEADGEKVLAIISNNDIRTVSLKGKMTKMKNFSENYF